jgi:hypothetical protein
VSLTAHPYDAVVDMTMFQLHGEEYSSKRLEFFSHARYSLHFVKTKCSLLSSKKPATGPKPEQDDSSPNY